MALESLVEPPPDGLVVLPAHLHVVDAHHLAVRQLHEGADPVRSGDGQREMTLGDAPVDGDSGEEHIVQEEILADILAFRKGESDA